MNRILYQVFKIYDKVIYSKKTTSDFERYGLDLHAVLIYSGITSVIFLNTPFNIIYESYFESFPLYYHIAIILIFNLYYLYKYIYKKELEKIVEEKPLFFNSEKISMVITIVYLMFGIYLVF